MEAIAACGYFTFSYSVLLIYLQDVIKFKIRTLKGIYFVIYGIISEFTDKGQFQYLINLKGSQKGTYLYTTQFLSLR